MEEFQDTTSEVDKEYCQSRAALKHTYTCAAEGCGDKYSNNDELTNYMNYCPPCYRQFRTQLDNELNEYMDNPSTGEQPTNAVFSTGVSSSTADDTAIDDAVSSTSIATVSATMEVTSTEAAAVTAAVSTTTAMSSTEAVSSAALVSSTASVSSTAVGSITTLPPMTLNDILAVLITLVRTKETKQPARIVMGNT